MPLGGEGLTIKMMMWWHFEGEGGRVETLSKYCCKMLEMFNKLMNFFRNHALISLNTAPTPQNIFLMIIEKQILKHVGKVIKQLTFCSSITSSIQWGRGVKTCDDLDDSGGGGKGVQNLWKPDDVILERSLPSNKHGEWVQAHLVLLVLLEMGGAGGVG